MASTVATSSGVKKYQPSGLTGLGRLARERRPGQGAGDGRRHRRRRGQDRQRRHGRQQAAAAQQAQLISMIPSGLRIASDATATSPSALRAKGMQDLPFDSILFLCGDPRSEFRAINSRLPQLRRETGHALCACRKMHKETFGTHRVHGTIASAARVRSSGWENPSQEDLK